MYYFILNDPYFIKKSKISFYLKNEVMDGNISISQIFNT